MKREPRALSEARHDLLVIGGGIFGAAVAWEAAQRDLKVALIEADDFGGGTSWNSLKTIHGGLRHLQRGEIRLLRESVRERRSWLAVAPDVVRPLEFVVPTRGHGARGREAVALGVLAADLLSFGKNDRLPPGHRLSAPRLLSLRQLAALVPALDSSGLSGGVAWWDAQVVDSERLTLALLHGAHDAGASLANRMRATTLRVEAGRVLGVRARDEQSGSELDIDAALTINCAGSGAAALLDTAACAAHHPPLIAGVNLVLERPAPNPDLALGALDAGRYLFWVPWRGVSIIGTGYASADDEAQLPRRFLADAQRAFPWAGLRESEVSVVHRGHVPGTPGRLAGDTRIIDHGRHGVGNLFSVIGAKLTTARAAAAAAVSRAAPTRPPAARELIPLAPPPSGTLEERTRYAVDAEMAHSLEDVVLRRLGNGTAGPPSAAELDRIVAALAQHCGWDAARQTGERDALSAGYARRSLGSGLE